MYHRHLLAAFRAACVLAALFSHVASVPARLRRQTSHGTYTIDTMVVVDDKLYSRFEQWMMTTLNVPNVDTEAKLKEYVSLLIHGVNDVYAGINHLPYTVRFQVVNMTINQNILGQASKGSGRVDINAALSAFRDWIRRLPTGTYDHAILLTSYDFKNTMSGAETRGHAYVGKLCDTDGYSASIVQEVGGFQNMLYVAHELGHNLGSAHDGEEGSVKCSAADHHIMAPVAEEGFVGNSTTMDNPWHFSSCSAASFDVIINSVTSSSSGSNCLSSTLTPIPEFTATANMVPGQLYPADVQCQMIHGAISRACLGENYRTVDEICTALYCLHVAENGQPGNFCRETHAAEGTTCGNKKWCRLGRCVESADAPALSQECPNGDSIQEINGLDCHELIKSKPYACYRDDIRKKHCCASCLSARGPAACPYGDRIINCVKDYCGWTLVSGEPYNVDCCRTCAPQNKTITTTTTTTTTTTSSCVDVSSIDGVPCAVRVAMKGRQECYNTSVADSCCLTCSHQLTNVPGCKYGDHYQGSYCNIPPENRHNCSETQKADCCASCNRATSGSWSGVVLSVVLLCGFIINTVQS